MNTYLASPKAIEEALESLGYEGVGKVTGYLGGVTNENFLVDGSYVLRMPYNPKSVRPYTYPYHIEQEMALMGLGPTLVSYLPKTGQKLSLYLEIYHPTDLDKCNQKIIHQITNAIKVIHKLSTIDKVVLDYYGDIAKWRKEVQNATNTLPNDAIDVFLEEFMPLYKSLMENQVFSHLDLVSSNILTDGNDIKLIDFEYSRYAFEWFDLVSLLSENDFSIETRDMIIDSYFEGDDKSKSEFLKVQSTLIKALDLYWSLWALSSLSNNPSKDEVFLKIASEKLARFKYL